jgi:WD repeat-containing protein 59
VPFEPYLVNQFVCHALIYAEMLFRWNLREKRLELLKLIYRNFKQEPAPTLQTRQIRQHDMGNSIHFAWSWILDTDHPDTDVVRTCFWCLDELRRNENICRSCNFPSTMPHCTICRLPVKGAQPHIECMIQYLIRSQAYRIVVSGVYMSLI